MSDECHPLRITKIRTVSYECGKDCNYINSLLILILIIITLVFIIAYLIRLTFIIVSLTKKEDKTVNIPSVNNEPNNNILAILEEIREGSQRVMKKSEKFTSMTEEFDKQISLCIQKVGISSSSSSDGSNDVAFALLNKQGDGIVIAFNKNNLSVKPLEKGHSPGKLTKKEEEAIDSALK